MNDDDPGGTSGMHGVTTPNQSRSAGMEPDVPEVSLPPIRTPDEDSRLAGEVKGLVSRGDMAGARERFDVLVRRQQRRATRIAFHFLRDAADADEAVQDAFVKVYSHITTFREDLPFEVWFTRILINGCLDRQKSRQRRSRWMVQTPEPQPGERPVAESAPASGPTPEELVLQRERRTQIARAVGQLPERQRTVFLLCHYEGCSSKEASSITGLNESTVRVHLFRAVRKLRALLGGSL